MPRSSSDSPEVFDVGVAERALKDACSAVGLDSAGATLMRLGENALFRLAAAPVVVRIARTLNYWSDAVNEVNVARWLASCDFAAAEVCDMGQPVEAFRRPVTFWKFIDGRPGAREDIAVLGNVLRKLHAMPQPTSFTLPAEDILGRVEPRIGLAPVPSADKTFLMSRLVELEKAVSDLRYPLQPGPTHGDAHSENLMIRNGQPVLIDFERFAWGQPEWDLAMTATEYRAAGWWTQDEYAEFADAYGYDVMAWDGFAVLQAVHEIKMTTWLMQNVEASKEISDEYAVRMRTIRGHADPGVDWKPF